jgi:hypothetical protein
MTGITVFIGSGLDELCWIRRSVRIMTVRTGQLSLSKRHMGRTHELRFTLEVALAADFCLRALVKERGLVADLGKLIPVGSLLHDGVAVNATHASPRMRARLPMGLHTALMTSETRLVLTLTDSPASFRNVIRPPTPLPPPALTWLLPGPWQFSQARFSVSLRGLWRKIFPITVVENFSKDGA